jgi:hypothetical protein
MLCIYDSLTLFLFALFCIEYRNRCSKTICNKIYYCGVFALMLIMCFKAPTTGEGMGDLQEYVNLYLGDVSMYDSDEVEPGLKWICNILHFLPESEFLFIAVTSLIIMLPILIGIKQYSESRSYSLMMLLTMQGVWLVVFIAIRQALAQAFVMSALLIYMNRERYKFWKYIVCAFLIASTFFHSIPFIIIPLCISTIFIPNKKIYLYIALIVSLLLSSTVYNLLADTFLSYFGGISEISRITRYIEDETYGMNTGFNVLNYAPMTLLACVIVYYSDTKSSKVYFLKAFILGVVLYNLLGNIPLVNRAVCFFFILGAIGAVPKIKNDKQFGMMAVMILYFIWRNYVHYAEQPHSVYLPYHFIWE